MSEFGQVSKRAWKRVASATRKVEEQSRNLVPARRARRASRGGSGGGFFYGRVKSGDQLGSASQTVVCDLYIVDAGGLNLHETGVYVFHHQPNWVLNDNYYPVHKFGDIYSLDNQSAFLEFTGP